jgi:hypothetical protein
MRPPKDKKHSEIARDLRRRWDPFPNVQLLGSYSQFSQVIDLNSVGVSDIRAAYAGGDSSAELRVMPLLTHEFQHLIDHVSTTWGRESLVSLFNAYNIRATGRSTDYARVTDFIRAMKTYHFTDYYTEYSDLALDPWDRETWSYNLTMGFQLASDGSERRDRPIIFTRFATHGGDFLCRVPFSLSSLLEVNASYQELVRELALIEAMGDAGVKAIERKLSSERWLERLYEPYSTMYTVAAHFVANRFDIRDALTAYQRAALLSSLCLELPGELFNRLRFPERWAEATGLDPHEALRASCDRGYLFAALVENARGIERDDIQDWLQGVLELSNLPPVAEIKAAADRSFAASAGEAIDGPARPRLDDLLRLGDEYRRAGARLVEAGGASPNVAPPPVLTRDDKFVTFKGGPRYGSFSNPGDWHREALRYHNLLDEFIEACAI